MLAAMAGMNLYEALTVGARRMNGCCVKTLNAEVNGRPKTEHVKVEGSGENLTVTVDCPTCKTRNVIRTDGASVAVEKLPGAAGQAGTEEPAGH